jgi:hypothetical protein
VSNLAEAGFLADELVGHGIEARIHHLDEFRATGDHWTSLYLIRVPAGAEHDAACHIRQHLAEGQRDADDAVAALPKSIAAVEAMWRPMVLVVLAGVASFVLGQRFSEQNVKPRPMRNALPLAVDKIGRPLSTDPEPGKPRFRLSFDRRRELWYLDADHNGDGKYDDRTQYHATGAIH